MEYFDDRARRKKMIFSVRETAEVHDEGVRLVLNERRLLFPANDGITNGLKNDVT